MLNISKKAGNHVFGILNYKISPGGMPPDPLAFSVASQPRPCFASCIYFSLFRHTVGGKSPSSHSIQLGISAVGLYRFVCSLCVAAVVVTRGNALTLGCTTIERRVLAGVWYMCTLCDL